MTCLLHITDTHVLGEPEGRYRELDTRASLEQVLALASATELAPDAVVLGGDISEDGSAASYAFVGEQVRTLGVPVGCVPGNHDDPAAMRAAFDEPPFLYTGVLDFGRWRVLLLDSHWPGEVAGRLSDESVRLLRDEFAASGDCHFLLCVHHHPVSIGNEWLAPLGLRDAARLFATIDAEPRVRGVLWGHVHQHYDAMRGGVRLLATPSTCRQFLPNVAQFALDTRGPAARRLSLLDDGTIETHLIGYADE